jgi:Cu+-exporting ATPase
MLTDTLPIEGMGCSACSTRIEKALNKLEGVTNAAVDFASQKANVTYDPDILDLSAIKEAITAEGYEVVEG